MRAETVFFGVLRVIPVFLYTKVLQIYSISSGDPSLLGIIYIKYIRSTLITLDLFLSLMNSILYVLVSLVLYKSL